MPSASLTSTASLSGAQPRAASFFEHFFAIEPDADAVIVDERQHRVAGMHGINFRIGVGIGVQDA